MNVPAKALIGLTALGGVAGGAGFVLHRQLSTENVNGKLVANGFQILDDQNNEWDAILTSYRSTVNKGDSNLKFENFEGNTGQKAQLIQECKKALEKPSTDKSNYEKAKHWCTVPRTSEKLLEKEGYKILSVDTNNEKTDKESWIKKLEDHVKNNAEFQNKKFTGISNIPVTGNVQKEKANIDAIKAQCATLNKKKHYEVEFKDNLDKVRLWCAVK